MKSLINVPKLGKILTLFNVKITNKKTNKQTNKQTKTNKNKQKQTNKQTKTNKNKPNKQNQTHQTQQTKPNPTNKKFFMPMPIKLWALSVVSTLRLLKSEPAAIMQRIWKASKQASNTTKQKTPTQQNKQDNHGSFQSY